MACIIKQMDIPGIRPFHQPVNFSRRLNACAEMMMKSEVKPVFFRDFPKAVQALAKRIPLSEKCGFFLKTSMSNP